MAQAGEGPPEGPYDAQSSSALLAVLERAGFAGRVWREPLNGRWLVFLAHGGRTYCLLPLEYERAGSRRQAQEPPAGEP